MVDLVFKDSEKKHKFHLVNPSPWPIVGAFSALFLVSGAILYMHYEMIWPMLAGLFLILFTMFMCCLLYTSPSPRDRTRSRMPSSA